MTTLNSTPDYGDAPSKISLAEAQKRVKRWLKHMLKIKHFKKHPDQIPRAIMIPIADLKQLLADYPDGIEGARLYFGLEKLLMGPENGQHNLELKGMLVPVLSSSHKDQIYSDKEEEQTNIYDFTTPCPRYCDTDSELYLKVGDVKS